jgi:hypothetical protein
MFESKDLFEQFKMELYSRLNIFDEAIVSLISLATISGVERESGHRTQACAAGLLISAVSRTRHCTRSR